MKKSDKITRMLAELGFRVVSDFRVIKGPKVKPDIIECWSVGAQYQGKHVEIYSADTMTLLCKTGLVVKPNDSQSQLYGTHTAEPKS